MRRIFAISLILFSQNVWAVKTTQYFVNGGQIAPNTASKTYGNICGTANAGWTTNTTQAKMVMPSSGTWQNLRVWTDGTTPGAGKSYTVAFMTNFSDSPISCTISDSSTRCWNTTVTSYTTVNDIVNFTVTPSGTPTSLRVHASIEFVTSTTNTFVYAGVGGLSTTASAYLGVSGHAGSNTTEVLRQMVVPTSGTFVAMVSSITAPPGAGKSYVMTLRKNGAATGLTCTMTNSVTFCTANSMVSVKPSDLLAIQGTPSGTPAGVNQTTSFIFVSSTPGEFPNFYQQQVGPSVSATNFMALSDMNSAPNATETLVQAPMISTSPAFIMKNIYVFAQTAPGAGKSYTFSLRKNSTSPTGAPTVTLQDTNTKAGSDAKFLQINTDDLVNSQSVPTGTPTIPGAFSIGYTMQLIQPEQLNMFIGGN
jgi:hypothetical protein